LIAFIVIVGASLAFFSDFVTGGITGTAGTLDLSVTTPVATTRHWTRAATPGGTVTEHNDSPGTTISNLNPGDIVEISYGVSNVGNKSAWMRNQVVLTIGTNHANVQPTTTGMFELYAAGTSREDIRSGAARSTTALLATSTNTSFTFNSTPIIINGTGAVGVAEIEPEGVTGAQNIGFLLHFRPTAGNEFQQVSVEYTVTTQAMQFRNNPNPNWADVVSNTFTLGTP